MALRQVRHPEAFQDMPRLNAGPGIVGRLAQSAHRGGTIATPGELRRPTPFSHHETPSFDSHAGGSTMGPSPGVENRCRAAAREKGATWTERGSINWRSPGRDDAPAVARWCS